MLVVNNISKVYEDGTAAVDSISFEFKKNCSYAIIGSSGCGKSTFLLMMAGIIKPSTGSIVFEGKEVNSVVDKSSVVFQDHGLLPWKSVFKNVELPLKIKHIERSKRKQKVERILKELGLDEFKNHFPYQLSIGMRQKVAFARSFVVDPEIVFLDEPTASLDALSREKLQDFMLELFLRGNFTSILVTHSIEEAVYLAKYILVFSRRPAKLKAVIENPQAGSKAYRNSVEFFEKCKSLRALIEF